MRQVKENRIVSPAVGDALPMAAYVALRLRQENPDFVNEFLGLDAALVPVPRSSLQRPGALWPAKEIAEELRSSGFGREVIPCLTRMRAVTKAATAAADERPRASDHQASLHVTMPVDLPLSVTLVDDVITRGAQAMGAAWALRKVRPDLVIRAFAVIRTISNADDFSDILAPTVGVITWRAGETYRTP